MKQLLVQRTNRTTQAAGPRRGVAPTIWLALGLLLAACGGQGGAAVIPTAAALPTITPTETPSPTETPLPPTLTPTPLPTETTTPSPTPIPTTAVPTALPSATFTWTPVPTSTSIPYLTPTPFPYTPPPGGQPVVGPAGAAASQPAPRDAAGNCLYAWFFASQTLPYCPATPPQRGQVAYLAFETGMMFWFAVDPAIYVLYYDSQVPRWQRYVDTWREGMPERDPLIAGPQGLWQQPRRGFGQAWRDNPMVRTRLGWALHEWETQYDGVVQQAGAEGGGAIYVLGPDGRGYQLYGDQTGWEIFAP